MKTDSENIKEIFLSTEFQLFLLTEKLSGVFWVADLEGKFLYINRDWFGLSKTELVDKDINCLKTKLCTASFRELDHALQEIRETIAEKSTIELCSEIYNIADFECYLLDLVPLVENNQLKAIVGVAKEITEKKKLELERNKSYRFLEEILNRLPIPLIGLSKDSKVFLFNENAERILGCTKTDVETNGFLESFISSEKELSNATRILQKVMDGELLLDHQFKVSRPDGQHRSLKFSTIPIFDENKVVNGAVACIQDITEQVQLEEKLKSSNEEMEDFVRLASHDLQSPLVSIQGYAQILFRDLKDRLDEDMERCFDGLFRNVKKMRELIETILNLSRLENQEEALQEFDTGKILSGIIDSFQQEAHGTGEFKLKGKFPVIKADPISFETIFTNLIDNAVKYSQSAHSGIQIEVGVKNAVGFYEFYVSDNGIGISPDDLDRIFHPLVRIKAVEVYGKGMGLSLVKKTVEKMGGKVWVKSQLGKGSSFFVAIPKKTMSSKR